MTPEQLSKVEENRQAALKKLSNKLSEAQTPSNKQSTLYSFFTPKSSSSRKGISQNLLSSPPALAELKISSVKSDADSEVSRFNQDSPCSLSVIFIFDECNFTLGSSCKEKRTRY